MFLLSQKASAGVLDLPEVYNNDTKLHFSYINTDTDILTYRHRHTYTHTYTNIYTYTHIYLHNNNNSNNNNNNNQLKYRTTSCCGSDCHLINSKADCPTGGRALLPVWYAMGDLAARARATAPVLPLPWDQTALLLHNCHSGSAWRGGVVCEPRSL